MSAKFKIEKNERGLYDLLMLSDEGLYECIDEFPTRQAAQDDIDAYFACEGAERRYQAQYAYACGYYD